MKSHNFQSFLFVFGILVVVFISSFLSKAPKPQPPSISEKEFSAFRAFEHTKQIAQKPHSMGTEEHERVKNYIISELNKLGIKNSIQTTTSTCYNEKKGLMAGYVHNIIGILKGSGGKKKVLLVGHYDSQPNALGAADDGSAVASMLESAKTLKQVGPFKNDILFLFTDGEETGLFGAQAFVDDNPLKDSVGIVLNIEARGSYGPSITYEVSPLNGWIMREYAKSVPFPFAQSIAYEIYKLLPNDSDFTPLKKAGLSGFNIGFIDGYVNYHSMTDSPDNLSLQSLQHHGSYIMAIAKHFGNLDLSNTKSEDVVYFNWIGHWLIIYPIGFNMFFVILISLLLICVVSVGIRKNRLSISRILISVLAFILTLVLTMLFTWVLLLAIKLVYPYYSNFYSSNFYNVQEYFFAFSCLAIAIFLAVYILLFRKISTESLLLGSLFVNFLLMLIFLVFIPTGAYLAIVPLLFILTGLLICFTCDFSFEIKRGAFLLVHFIALLPTTLLLVPFIGMLFVTFGLNTIYIGVAVLVVLMGYWVVPVKLFYERKKWSLPLIAVLFFVGNLIVGQLTSGYTKNQPLQSNVSYFLNSEKNEALWFSSKRYTDEWKAQFFADPEFKPLPDLFPKSRVNYLQNNAQVYIQSPPELSVIADSIKDGSRKISLLISSTRKAQNCEVFIGKNANLLSFRVNGKNISDKEFYTDSIADTYSLYYFGLSEKGLELTMNCKTKEKIDIIVVESKLGLPHFEDYKPMPDFIIPDKGFISNVTLVKKSWKL